MIAAIYVVLTIVFAPFSYGEVQVRISEALTILPVFTPAAIPGLFIGCLISNIFGGCILPDIIVGSLEMCIRDRSIPVLWFHAIPSPPVSAARLQIRSGSDFHLQEVLYTFRRLFVLISSMLFDLKCSQTPASYYGMPESSFPRQAAVQRPSSAGF